MALTGPGGLLKSVTKLVIETALEEHDRAGLGIDADMPPRMPVLGSADSANSRVTRRVLSGFRSS